MEDVTFIMKTCKTMFYQVKIWLPILEMGWTDMFECRISKINEEAHPEYQVHLTIKIKRNIA